MSDQASVHSIDSLKELRVAMALFGDDALGALGAVDMEIRRTANWLQHDRPAYWQTQIKRRREQVTSARAEVARRRLMKTPDSHPAMSEQKELLRKAEASLQEAEMRVALVKKWGPMFQQAILEYHASARRISDLASGDVPRAIAVLERMIEALEGYLRVMVPSGSSGPSGFTTVVDGILDQAEAASEAAVVADSAAPPPVAEEHEPIDHPLDPSA